MHDYSIDRHPKEKVLFVLAFAAIASAPILNALVREIVTNVGINTRWSSPSVTAIPVFGLFGFFYWLFNKFFWRAEILRKFLLVPDFNGKWKCDGRTIIKDGNSADYQWSGEVTITQSWSKMLIHLQTAQSHSKSISASIYFDDGIGYRLLYQYENNPRADQVELSRHSGAVELVFDLKCETAKGNYFTDQHRKTVGIMSLWRK